MFIPKISQSGTVLSVSKSGKIQVQLDLGKMFFEINDLELKENKSTSKKVTSNCNFIRKDLKIKDISPEINVLGKTVDEACFEIDKYLDN